MTSISEQFLKRKRRFHTIIQYNICNKFSFTRLNNADIKISKGDVLKFDLDVGGHRFWIKTVQGAGTDKAVSSGISGVGQGKTSGVLIWNTTTFEDGIYYYQCEFHANMFGKIIVGEGILHH